MSIAAQELKSGLHFCAQGSSSSCAREAGIGVDQDDRHRLIAPHVPACPCLCASASSLPVPVPLRTPQPALRPIAAMATARVRQERPRTSGECLLPVRSARSQLVVLTGARSVCCPNVSQGSIPPTPWSPSLPARVVLPAVSS